jgi:hypothetical protein
VMGILVLGFGIAFAVSMPTNDAFYSTNGTIFPGLLTTTMAMAQDFDIDQYHGVASMAMFLLFLYLVIIVMFNVLIAIVSDVYNKVMDTADVEVDTQRAMAIIDEERLMSDADLRNPDFFPHFIEVLQKESGNDKVVHSGARQVQEDVAQLTKQMSELDEKINAMGAQNDAQSKNVEKLLEMMSAGQRQQAAPPSKFHSAVGQMVARSRAKQ